MNYHAPTSLDAAVDILAGAGGHCRVLAGGTDLLVRIRSEMADPDTVVDIKRIESLRTITQEPDGGWRIGAAVSGAEMGEHAGLCAAWPGVVEAAGLIGLAGAMEAAGWLQVERGDTPATCAVAPITRAASLMMSG